MAADIIKIVMIRVNERKQNISSTILQVHDELLGEAAKRAEDMVKQISEEMHT